MFKVVLAVTIAISASELALQVAGNDCEDDEFRCNSGQCIPGDSRCDQWVDCPGEEQEDEEGCEKRPCSYWRDFQCNNGVCILGYQQCNGYKDCKENEDEACGPKCNDCNGWKKLANHELDCGGVSKYTESCSASDTCATRWKQSKNGVLKVWLGCMDQGKCNRLEEKNAPSCKDEPKGVAKGKGCTFCCANSDHCNKSLTKKEVVAV